MIRFLSAAALALSATAALAAEPRISVNVGVPGLYGNVDIGNGPRPQVLYARPVYAEREPSRVEGPPVYLHVPPGHERHWREHCREYDACGRPVYFVRHDWYRDNYARRGDHREDGRDRRDERGDGRDRRDERGDGRDRRDERDDHRDGRGNGRRD